MKYYIETYGCQMNVYDSRKIEEMLRANALSPAGRPEEADVILVNTCSVREHAERRALARIGELSRRKRAPETTLAVCGCMAQRMGSELLRRPGVNLVLGPDCYSNLLSHLADSTATGSRLLDTTRDAGFRFQASAGPGRQGLRSFVSIMKGCSNDCSFCIVPSVRGPAVSRPSEEVLVETRELAGRGAKDVTLIGQNVNAYRSGAVDFSGLLGMVAEAVPDARVRFTTSHPKDMNQSVLETMAGHANVCEHIHLPLQSGSDRILSSMHRGYTVEQYRDIVDLAREVLPEVSITTDIIVGFPGETESDFQKTCSFVEETMFDSAFMFKFSPRPGTEAARLADDVPLKEKELWLSRLIELERGVSRKKSSELVGRELEVLVEDVKVKNGTRWLAGRTRCNRTVLFEGSSEKVGKLVKVRIDSCKEVSLSGTLVPA